MFRKTNPNPDGLRVGDCVVRAIAIALDISWIDAYLDLCLQGLLMRDMPSANAVWDAYLQAKGFTKDVVTNARSVKEYCGSNPEGISVLGTGQHVVTVINGDYYDAWDSGDEIPVFVWRRS